MTRRRDPGPPPGPSETPGRRTRRSTVLAWVLWALAVLCLAPVVWLDQLLRQSGRPDLLLLDFADIPFGLATLSAASVGAVVATQRPRHPVGWLLLALGLSVPVAGVVQGYARYGLTARPGALPAADLVAAYTVAISVAWITCVGFILVLTPSGSLPSPRWRWPARIATAAPVAFMLSQVFGSSYADPIYHAVENPLAVPALATVLEVTAGVSVLTVGATLLVAVGSIIQRIRRARAAGRVLEYQQLRWVVVAALLAGMLGLAVLPGNALGVAGTVLTDFVVGLYVAVLPLGIGASVLRYRLYDLDRIISRTISYALLTVLLGACYAAVVVGLGWILGGQASNLAVAAATLAAAMLFQPARRRVQALVDRRFDRRRYDAARIIDGLAARLRQEVDLDTLATELLGVVDRTMQPTRAALWLRPARGAVEAAVQEPAPHL